MRRMLGPNKRGNTVAKVQRKEERKKPGWPLKRKHEQADCIKLQEDTSVQA